MEITLLRIDSRLVHGQVIEAWIPFTGASTIVVVDDVAAKDLMMKEVMKMAVPPDIDLHCASVDEFVSGKWAIRAQNRRVLILCRNLKVARKIVNNCPGIMNINVGNLHYERGKREVSPTVFIDLDDEKIVRELEKQGVEVDVKAVPSDRKIKIKLK